MSPQALEAPESDFDPDNFEVVHHGPTWERDKSTGKFILPERTLGWECLTWCHKYLKNPETNGPWEFTSEQARFILWWYALDKNGVFAYRGGTLRRLKGWGKDPLAACLALFELLGNCRFSHWDQKKRGGAAGKQPAEPWIIIAAVNLAQTKTTAKLFQVLPTAECVSKYQLKVGAELVKANGGIGTIECVTSSPHMLESYRPSFIIQNETHHWVRANDGFEMASVLRRIAGKKDSRVLSLTNAHMPNIDSVGRDDWDAYKDVLAGRSISTGVVYDSLEAPPEATLADPDTIAKVLAKVRGDSIWFPIARIVQEILDSRTPPSEARRFYYNQAISSEDVLITEAEWSRCLAAVLDPLKDGDEVVLGLDGGRSDDSTVLVAFRIRDRMAFRLHSQEKPKAIELKQGEKWYANLDALDAAVTRAFRNYKVRAFFSDVHPLESYITKWSEKYRDAVLIRASTTYTVGFDMRGNQNDIGRMNEALVGSIREKGILHDGDEVLTQHVLNAYQNPLPNSGYMSFAKESRESERKVDAYAAMLLAFIALNKYLESGKRPEEEDEGQGWFW